MKKIDAHCHVYPRLSYFLKENIGHIPSVLLPLIKKIELIENRSSKSKEFVAQLVIPIMDSIHKLQALTNNNSSDHLFIKDKLFNIGFLTTILSSTLNDLDTHMKSNEIDTTLLIAHPPFISNDFILESCKNNKKLKPIINIPLGTKNIPSLFESYVHRGAVGLKIHAAADGLDPMDEHYHALLQLAQENSLPVTIHTGALEIEPIYKGPSFGHAEMFESWFSKYNTNFILAHMNIHFPEEAIRLCKEYDNVYTDTSWQHENTILQAVNELGSKKILFGTDWPIIGNNIQVCLNRLNKLLETNEISVEDYNNIMYKNAESLFNL